MFPRYVYKISDVKPPSPIPDILPLSNLDSKDGFIHLSDAHRIPVTASQFFADAPTVWVLKVIAQGDLRWVEDKNLAGCVHLHGANLGKSNVVDVKQYKNFEGDDKDWINVFAAHELNQKWLVNDE